MTKKNDVSSGAANGTSLPFESRRQYRTTGAAFVCGYDVVLADKGAAARFECPICHALQRHSTELPCCGYQVRAVRLGRDTGYTLTLLVHDRARPPHGDRGAGCSAALSRLRPGVS